MATEFGPAGADLDAVEHRVKHSRAGWFLQEHCYEYTYVGSWYGPTRDSKIPERSRYPDAELSFTSALYDLSLLPVLFGGSEGSSGHCREHADAVEYQFDVLGSIAGEPGRQYVFAHILEPHKPFVFLEDGTYAPDEATFATQLADANCRIRAFVEPLISLPESKRPIIIQGDGSLPGAIP